MASNKISRFSIPVLLTIIILGCSASSRKTEDLELLQDYNGDSSEFVPIDTAPVPVEESQPIFPKYALDNNIFGSVVIKVLIDTLGNVENALVFRNSGSKVGFEESALKAAKENKWKPALYKGRPVSTWVTYKVDFYYNIPKFR